MFTCSSPTHCIFFLHFHVAVKCQLSCNRHRCCQQLCCWPEAAAPAAVVAAAAVPAVLLAVLAATLAAQAAVAPVGPETTASRQSRTIYKPQNN